MGASRIAAVIEVGSLANGRVPVGLVRAAYRASHSGTVVLVLNGVSATEVDRALDEVVSVTKGVKGVVYCSPESLGTMLLEGGLPRLASAGTQAIAGPLARQGVPILPPSSLLRALRGPGQSRRRALRQERSERAARPQF
jgi:hypothetical protein